ncbi:hypothetical protein AX17_000634 [Amanita inopinata Kibby_2008]|nr:hypothetical protein AX17_000634 [Amanita inopinata Kibby_2008]
MVTQRVPLENASGPLTATEIVNGNGNDEMAYVMRLEWFVRAFYGPGIDLILVYTARVLMADEFDLESLVHVEETFYDVGYQDGFAHGRIHGLIEGRALGREKGFEMWEELGFYEGFALMWAAIYKQQGRVDDRATNHVKHLLELISQFPRVNPSAVDSSSELDIPRLFRQIRSRYKALCSTLGVRPSLRASEAGGTDDLNEMVDEEPAISTNKKVVWQVNGVDGGSSQRRRPPQPLSF